MDKRSRAYKIYEAGVGGLLEHESLSLQSAMLFRVMATMIDYATKKPSKKESAPLLYVEKDLLEALPVQLEVARYGPLTRQLKTINQKTTDIELFVAWFSEIMLPWLKSKDIEFTYSMLTKKFPEWLEKSRQHAPKQPEKSAWR